VYEGRNLGIYFSWSACFAETNWWNNDTHKSFDTLEEAKTAYKEHYDRVGRVFEKNYINCS